MRKHRLLDLPLFVLLALSLLLTTCGQPTPVPPTPTPAGPSSAFEKAECPSQVPSGHQVTCGYLTVPEDRSQSGGKTIRLAVAIYKSKSSSPAPDPIVYLEGGPGGSPLRSYKDTFDLVFAPFLEKRDLILLDQRGTGYSEPALDCPETVEMALESIDENLSPEEDQNRAIQSLAACRDRLKSQGVNLAAYTSAENAADLNDLRLALGYQSWNLYGASYGTRLALTEMRDFPQGIRSVVLDSVFPPQVNLITDAPGNIDRALDLLFDSCAAQPACNTAYPDLRSVLYDLVDQLNATPAKIGLILPSGEHADGLLSGDDLLSSVFQALYSSRIIPMLPRIIYQARDGNYAAIALLESEILKEMGNVSHGMYYSVECGEDIPFATPAEMDAALQAHPELSSLFGGNAADDIFTLCQNWGSRPPAAVEDQAVQSDIPTLVLSGQYDPVTPPEWGQLAAQTLSRSFFLEFPGAGHGASLTEQCPRSVALAFLDNPTAKPEASCVQQEMSKFAFATPVAASQVNMVPFEDTTMGISGVVPEGWKQISLGTYSPQGLATDQEGLVQMAAPMAAAQFLELLQKQFATQSLDMPSQSTGSRPANGLDWSLYQLDAGVVAVDVALAEKEGTTYVIMLQSMPNEHDALYQAIFLPAVDALKPLSR